MPRPPGIRGLDPRVDVAARVVVEPGRGGYDPRHGLGVPLVLGQDLVEGRVEDEDLEPGLGLEVRVVEAPV